MSKKSVIILFNSLSVSEIFMMLKNKREQVLKICSVLLYSDSSDIHEAYHT